MARYKLIIAYDGSNYSGWQAQKNALSIQETIEKALALIAKKEMRIVGAGRTDAGVHARGQVAHFDVEEPLDTKRALLSLNGLLPPDIRVKELMEATPEFHAQRSALCKVYHYHLWCDPVLDPFTSKYSLPVYEKISLPLLRQAACCFVGKKDFASFTNTGSCAKTTVRTLFRLDVVEQTGGLRLEFAGDGFLYKMVRNITGTLLEVVKGKRELGSLPGLFEGRDRRRAGLAVSPRGLFLHEVFYRPDVTKNPPH